MKLPRDLSGADVVKALRRLGFHPTAPGRLALPDDKDSLKVAVPNHQAIVPKTLQNVLRQASVTLEEFLEAL